MKDLIEALTIFRKYEDATNPTHCEHDVLQVMHVTEEEVSEEDRKRLGELGFNWDAPGNGGDGCWISYRYGSA
jgi:hypothetical protein